MVRPTCEVDGCPNDATIAQVQGYRCGYHATNFDSFAIDDLELPGYEYHTNK